MNFSNFSLILASLLVLCASWTDAQIFPFVKQYYECKNLKMIKSVDYYGREYYKPDGSVEGNTLEDSFYAGLGFDTMNIDDAMSLIKSIYDELPEDCETEFCECVWLRRFQTVAESYAVFFETDERIESLKTIITSLDEKLSASRYSYEDYTSSFSSYEDPQNYPTLTKFVYNNEYTYNRIGQFKNYRQCVHTNSVSNEYSTSCKWSSSIDFEEREFITNPTSEQQENKAICYLLYRTKCPPEQQRFELLSSWNIVLLQLDWSLLTTSILDYLDSLISRAASYVPETFFESTEIYVGRDFFSVSSYRNGWDYADLTPEYTSNSLDAIKSDSFSVQIKLDFDSEGQGYLTQAVINTVYGSQDVSITLDESTVQEYINQNGTFILADDGVRVFQVMPPAPYEDYLQIIDFNSKSIIQYSKTDLGLIALKSLLESSNTRGLLVDGIQNPSV